MQYTSHLGCHFTDSKGIHVRNYQLLANGVAVAICDFENGVCKRFMFADSHAEAAQKWRKGFQWIACGLCYGRGFQREYGEQWPCPPCEGTGGFVSDSISFNHLNPE